jgi:hypothetical protein
MSEEETEILIPVIVPTYNVSTINGIPDYTAITEPSYDGSNFLQVLAEIKQLLVNETSGESSNFMRTSGSQLIIGSKQFTNISVIPDINAEGDIEGDATLTVQKQTYLNGGLYLNNNLIFDISGNLTIDNVTIPKTTKE